jgi:hypothetical protein
MIEITKLRTPLKVKIKTNIERKRKGKVEVNTPSTPGGLLLLGKREYCRDWVQNQATDSSLARKWDLVSLRFSYPCELFGSNFRPSFTLLKDKIRHNPRVTQALVRHAHAESSWLMASSVLFSYDSSYLFTSQNRNRLCIRPLCPRISLAIIIMDKVTAPMS